MNGLAQKIGLTLGLSAVAIFSSIAHPGHGTADGHSPEHYMTSPLHVVFYVAAAVGLLYLAYRSLARQKR